MPYMAGDIGLSRGNGLVERSIQWAESRRYGSKSREALWSHAFIFETPSTVIEAQSQGVVRTNFTAYRTTENVVYRPPYPAHQVDAAVGYAAEHLGKRYNYLELASQALAFVFQTKLRFGVAGEFICSGLVSCALDAGEIRMGDDFAFNSPADLLHLVIQGGWPQVFQA